MGTPNSVAPPFPVQSYAHACTYVHNDVYMARAHAQTPLSWMVQNSRAGHAPYSTGPCRSRTLNNTDAPATSASTLVHNH